MIEITCFGEWGEWRGLDKCSLSQKASRRRQLGKRKAERARTRSRICQPGPLYQEEPGAEPGARSAPTHFIASRAPWQKCILHEGNPPSAIANRFSLSSLCTGGRLHRTLLLSVLYFGCAKDDLKIAENGRTQTRRTILREHELPLELVNM